MNTTRKIKTLFITRLPGHALPTALVIAFTMPQFFTALAGGALALGMVRIMKNQH